MTHLHHLHCMVTSLVRVVCSFRSIACLVARWKPTLQSLFFLKLTFVIYLVILFSIKLGVMEDHSNRTRLAKLLRFFSSNSEKELTSLAEYVERMKEKQDAIYFMAGTSRKEVSIVR